MRGQLHCTKDVPQRQKFAYWQDLICDVLVDLDCTAAQQGGFDGAIYDQHFGDLQISTMTSDPMSLRRSPSRISRAREDRLLVAIEGRHRSFGAQDGREAVLERNDLALFDSTRPYDVGFAPNFQHFVLKMPRSALLKRIGPVQGLTARRIAGSSGSGRIAVQFFRTLAEDLDGIDEATAAKMGEIGLDLLAAALSTVGSNAELSRSAVRTTWLVRARTHVLAHLSDPELTPRTVAAALGISVRYLNMLFDGEDTSLERFIWDSRLRRCRAALADPAQRGLSISSIAFAWGYSDMSHFSRAFRRFSHCSPREFRAAAADETRDSATLGARRDRKVQQSD